MDTVRMDDCKRYWARHYRIIQKRSVDVVPDGSVLYSAQYLCIDLCSARTRARAVDGMHSMRPSSGDVGSTLHSSAQSQTDMLCSPGKDVS